MNTSRYAQRLWHVIPITLTVVFLAVVGTTSADESTDTEKKLLAKLDAPLLFVKRHSYSGIHIYDTFYKWPPGGGGIYVLENPNDHRRGITQLARQGRLYSS